MYNKNRRNKYGRVNEKVQKSRNSELLHSHTHTPNLLHLIRFGHGFFYHYEHLSAGISNFWCWPNYRKFQQMFFFFFLGAISEGKAKKKEQIVENCNLFAFAVRMYGKCKCKAIACRAHANPQISYIQRYHKSATVEHAVKSANECAVCKLSFVVNLKLGLMQSELFFLVIRFVWPDYSQILYLSLSSDSHHSLCSDIMLILCTQTVNDPSSVCVSFFFFQIFCLANKIRRHHDRT